MLYLVAIIIWLVANIVVRILGQFLFDPSHPLFYLLILLTLPAVYGFTYSLYYKFKLSQQQKIHTGAILFPVLMLLEIPVFLYWQILFPNMNSNTILTYAIYLLGFYGLCIVTLRFNDPIKRTTREQSSDKRKEHQEEEIQN